MNNNNNGIGGLLPNGVSASSSSSARVAAASSMKQQRSVTAAPNVPLAAQPRSKARITVTVRKRPLTQQEASKGETDVLIVPNKRLIRVDEPKKNVQGVFYIEAHEFRLDRVYDENCTNEEVYLSCIRPLVDAVFKEGGRCSCFAYGQTGSGKTHTMVGPAKLKNFTAKEPIKANRGVFELATRDLVGWVKTSKFSNYGLFVSFFEIYCNKVFDLLNSRKLVRALETRTADGVVVKDLMVQRAESESQLMKMIELGLSNRTVGKNSRNNESSRGHAILTIEVRHLELNNCHGKLAFIDLAGSERGADTLQAQRQTQQDGAGINKSLLALKECIRALDMQSPHVPFRDAELTKVLRDMFMARTAQTVMIANVAPAGNCCEQSLNTLRYADRVFQLRQHCKPCLADPDLAANDPTMSSMANSSTAGAGSGSGTGTNLRRSRSARPQQQPTPSTATVSDDNMLPAHVSHRHRRANKDTSARTVVSPSPVPPRPPTTYSDKEDSSNNDGTSGSESFSAMSGTSGEEEESGSRRVSGGSDSSFEPPATSDQQNESQDDQIVYENENEYDGDEEETPPDSEEEQRQQFHEANRQRREVQAAFLANNASSGGSPVLGGDDMFATRSSRSTLTRAPPPPTSTASTGSMESASVLDRSSLRPMRTAAALAPSSLAQDLRRGSIVVRSVNAAVGGVAMGGANGVMDSRYGRSFLSAATVNEAVGTQGFLDGTVNRTLQPLSARPQGGANGAISRAETSVTLRNNNNKAQIRRRSSSEEPWPAPPGAAAPEATNNNNISATNSNRTVADAVFSSSATTARLATNRMLPGSASTSFKALAAAAAATRRSSPSPSAAAPVSSAATTTGGASTNNAPSSVSTTAGSRPETSGLRQDSLLLTGSSPSSRETMKAFLSLVEKRLASSSSGISGSAVGETAPFPMISGDLDDITKKSVQSIFAPPSRDLSAAQRNVDRMSEAELQQRQVDVMNQVGSATHLLCSNLHETMVQDSALCMNQIDLYGRFQPQRNKSTPSGGIGTMAAFNEPRADLVATLRNIVEKKIGIYYQLGIYIKQLEELLTSQSLIDQAVQNKALKSVEFFGISNATSSTGTSSSTNNNATTTSSSSSSSSSFLNNNAIRSSAASPESKAI